MAYFLMILGIALLAWGWFYQRDDLVVTELKEAQEKLEGKVAEANLIKEDLSCLMVSATHMGEKLVEELESRLNQARELLMSIEGSILQGGRIDLATQTPAETNPLRERAPVVAGEGGDESPGTSSSDNRIIPERYERVRVLAAKGWRVEQIAETLNMGKGEVELILSLEQRR